MLMTISALFPLLTFGVLPLGLCILLILVLLLGQLFMIIYVNNNYILNSQLATHLLPSLNRREHRNVTYDSYSEATDSFSDRLLRTVKFFAEQHTSLFFLSLFSIVMFSLLMPLVFEGGCLGKYDEMTNSVNLFSKYAYSTKFIRSLHPPDCNGEMSEEPCHVYVTASEPDPSTNMIINFQIASNTCKLDDCKPVLFYSNQKHMRYNQYDNVTVPVEVENDFLNYHELRARRRVYRAYLSDLQPGIDYSFVIFYQATNYSSLRYKFRTPH